MCKKSLSSYFCHVCAKAKDPWFNHRTMPLRTVVVLHIHLGVFCTWKLMMARPNSRVSSHTEGFLVQKKFN